MAEASRQPKPPPLYYSTQGEAELRRLYGATLAGLPAPHEERWVDTPSFGRTHVLVCGPQGAPPLVLWHGTAAPGPFMLSAMRPLAEHYRVFVPDIPCQAGSRSDPAVLDPASHGYGRWCAEVLGALGLLGLPVPPPASSGGSGAAAASPSSAREGEAAVKQGEERPPLLHVGVSLGGAVLLDLAAVKPEAVGAAVLVVPGSLHPGANTGMSLRAVLASLMHWLIRRNWSGVLLARAMMTAMCDEPDSQDPAMQNVRLAFRHCRFFPAPPRPFTEEELRRLTAPVLLVAAEHDVFGLGRGTIQRALEVWPAEQCETLLLEGGKHVGSSERTAEVNQHILHFLGQVLSARGSKH